ncbi:hypothetical protein NCC49_004948 [Naganishia albida]|nr:hypothetical protein NCC49_004948 [Naganishia albida]
MTVTLPLELARPRPIDLPNTAPPITSTTNKRNKSRGPSAKRKSAPKAASVVSEPSPANQGPPLYEQFGTVPTNPTYHLARVGHAIRQARNIIVISGAGVSTPAIPDFRSSRGLFKTLADDEKRKNMLEAETCGKTRAQKREAAAEAASAAASSSKSGMRSGKELFDVKCLTSPDLLPYHHNLLNHLTLLTSRTPPTPFHHYLKTLDDQGRLLRCYTQNIDGLEQKAGLDLRVPLEGDFPKRRRTGMSRDNSRKSDVFAKSREGEASTQAGNSQDTLPATKESLGVPSFPEPVRRVSLPISRLLNSQNECPSIGSHFTAGMTEVTPQTLPDGFEVDSAFTFPTSDDRPYAAASDPFCQMTRVDDNVGLPITRGSNMNNINNLFSASLCATLNVKDATSARSASPTARATSVTRSLSGTTDTSATSVSGKIEGQDTDVDRDTEKPVQAEPKTADRLSPPSIASLSQSIPMIEEPKLPRCVPLHGTLANLECSRCSYSQPLRDAVPLGPELLPCPSCDRAWEERVESSQRPRSIGFLRASVLLYGEEHRHGDSIGAVVERDLLGRLKDERMDLLVVAGTTLQIPGVKRMIKEFAKALRTQPQPKKKAPRKSGAADPAPDKDAASAGTFKSATPAKADDADSDDFPIQTILLNRDPPSKGKGGEWANTFDVWVQGDLQEFVQQWVIDGPPPDSVTTKSAPLADPTLRASQPTRETKIEVTEKLTALGKGKRKQAPSPEKATLKGKTGRATKSAKITSAFPSVKSAKASPQKQSVPLSPDTSMSDDFAVEISIPIPRPAAAKAKQKSAGKGNNRPHQQTQPDSTSVVTSSQPKAARPVKPRTVGTRKSKRQEAAANAIASGLPLTPRKRPFNNSGSSSPLSALSSDEEECSSQGAVEKAL